MIFNSLLKIIILNIKLIENYLNKIQLINNIYNKENDDASNATERTIQSQI